MISVGVVFYKESLLSLNLFLSHLLGAVNVANSDRLLIKEIVFVLNSEDSNLKKLLNNFLNSIAGKKITLVFIQNSKNNVGLARKLILDAVTTEWVYFTDPDVILHKNTLVELNDEIPLFNCEKYLGITGTVVQESKTKFLSELFTSVKNLGSLFGFAFQGAIYKIGTLVDHAPTAHFLVNKSVAQKLGGFSTEFEICGEDLDLTHRATQRGHLIYFGKSRVIHVQNLTLIKSIGKFFEYGHAQALVFFKNGYCSQRLYRLIPAVVTIMFGLLVMIGNKTIMTVMCLVILSMLLIVPQLVFILVTVMTYGLGTIYGLIIELKSFIADLFFRQQAGKKFG